MSTALAVFHGVFGRVCLYAMDRRMAPHAHREGHLLFHVTGPPGTVVVDDIPYPIAPGQAVAISPWQPHYYCPLHDHAPTLALVLYIRASWFLEASRRASASLRFGRVGVEVTDHLARLVCGNAQSMLDPDRDDPAMEDRLSTLTQAAFDQSWQWTSKGDAFLGNAQPKSDYRIRNALRLIQQRVGDSLELDTVAREVGLSRPHFFKLFRAQMGLTPNLYLNALRMERAIDLLADSREAVAKIGFNLGFSSQASFSRFFIANGVVPPSAYRRSVYVTNPA
ncbi:MAG: AraC family transcriptional regulator [Pseudomonadota bacterium]